VWISIQAILFPGSLIKIEKVNVSLLSDQIKIKQDIYEVDCKYDEIIRLDTLSSLPEINYRSNGIGLDTLLAGHFNMQGIEDAMLFLDPESPPFIHFLSKKGQHVFLNLDHHKKTIELYQKLKEKRCQVLTPDSNKFFCR
jgi:hypothetical protein